MSTRYYSRAATLSAIGYNKSTSLQRTDAFQLIDRQIKNCNWTCLLLPHILNRRRSDGAKKGRQTGLQLATDEFNRTKTPRTHGTRSSLAYYIKKHNNLHAEEEEDAHLVNCPYPCMMPVLFLHSSLLHSSVASSRPARLSCPPFPSCAKLLSLLLSVMVSRMTAYLETY